MSKTVSYKGINQFNRRDLEQQKGGKLDHSAYANFTTLGKNGLIAKVMYAVRRKAGYWCMTRKGYRFLLGTPVPDCVWTWERKIVARSPVMKTISEILRMTPYAPSLDEILADYPEPTIDDVEQMTLPTFVKLIRGKAQCPKCNKPMRTEQPGEWVTRSDGEKSWRYTGEACWVCPTCGMKVNKENPVLT